MRKILLQNKLTFLSLLICLGMFGVYSAYYSPDSSLRQTLEDVRLNVGGAGVPQLGGGFQLVNHQGETVTHDNFLGKATLYYFGYSSCPDVCPTGLAKITAAYASLNEEMQQKLNLVFITVDPARDTVDMLKDYNELFENKFQMLTGEAEAINAVAKKFLVYHVNKKPDEDGVYMVDHSSYTYLHNAEGVTLELFPYNVTVEELQQALEKTLFK